MIDFKSSDKEEKKLSIELDRKEYLVLFAGLSLFIGGTFDNIQFHFKDKETALPIKQLERLIHKLYGGDRDKLIDLLEKLTNQVDILEGK